MSGPIDHVRCAAGAAELSADPINAALAAFALADAERFRAELGVPHLSVDEIAALYGQHAVRLALRIRYESDLPAVDQLDHLR